MPDDCDDDRDKFGYRLVKDLATRTTGERGVNRRTRNHDWNICWAFWRGLLKNAQLSICLEVRRMIQRFVSVFKLGFSSVDLKKG